jgi:hypothetical protein
MNDSMSTMVLIGLSQSEWELLMQFVAKSMTGEDEKEEEQLHNIISKVINQVY